MLLCGIVCSCVCVCVGARVCVVLMQMHGVVVGHVWAVCMGTPPPPTLRLPCPYVIDLGSVFGELGVGGPAPDPALVVYPATVYRSLSWSGASSPLAAPAMV